MICDVQFLSLIHILGFLAPNSHNLYYFPGNQNTIRIEWNNVHASFISFLLACFHLLPSEAQAADTSFSSSRWVIETKNVTFLHSSVFNNAFRGHPLTFSVWQRFLGKENTTNRQVKKTACSILREETLHRELRTPGIARLAGFSQCSSVRKEVSTADPQRFVPWERSWKLSAFVLHTLPHPFLHPHPLQHSLK